MLALRRPGNPLGWIMLGLSFFFALSEDASYYSVADYGLRHGDLPLGGIALLVQPAWAPGIVLAGVLILLFPDGRPPSSRWQWLAWAYLVVGVLWTAGTAVITVGALIDHHTQVDAGGNLLLLRGSDPAVEWWNVLQAVFFPLLAAYAGLVLLATQVFRFHSSVAVAVSTLAAAALFAPVRRWVQRAVDRRFNRARYDAERTVAAFAARLKDAVDLDSVRDDLAGTVHRALEPEHLSVWVSYRG